MSASRKTRAPGKSHRQGISLMQLADMFPDEESAVRWFEKIHWPDGQRYCGRCGGMDTRVIPNAKPMPYWCRDCKKYFSVRTGTSIESSRLPLRKWAFATYLYVTNLKGVSSMKLHRDLKVTQKTAWFMLHRLRESWDASGLEQFIGPVEVDETHMGGKRKNKSLKKRKQLSGHGPVDMTTVAGVKDRETNRVRAKVIESADAPTLQGFVREHVQPGASVYTDEARGYIGLKQDFDHDAVNHSVSE